MSAKFIEEYVSLLSVVGKLYGGILIDRVRKIIDCMFGDEQSRFRPGRGFIDKVFPLGRLFQKTPE